MVGERGRKEARHRRLFSMAAIYARERDDGRGRRGEGKRVACIVAVENEKGEKKTERGGKHGKPFSSCFGGGRGGEEKEGGEDEALWAFFRTGEGGREMGGGRRGGSFFLPLGLDRKRRGGGREKIKKGEGRKERYGPLSLPRGRRGEGKEEGRKRGSTRNRSIHFVSSPCEGKEGARKEKRNHPNPSFPGLAREGRKKLGERGKGEVS